MISRLPAIAPRVAKATAKAVAAKTSPTIPMPRTTSVFAMAARRSTQSRWSSSVAPRSVSDRPLRSSSKFGRWPEFSFSTIDAGHRQLAEIEPGAEPGLEQALGFRLAEILTSATPGDARAIAAAFATSASISRVGEGRTWIVTSRETDSASRRRRRRPVGRRRPSGPRGMS